MLKNSKWKLFFLFSVSFLVRCVYFTFSPPRLLSLDDAVSWDSIAQNLNLGKGFEEGGQPTSARPPVYPLFLAAVYKIFGHRPDAANCVQLFLSAFTSVWIFLIGKKLFGEKVGVIASLLSSFYPPLIVYSTILGSETLYTFFLIWAFYLFITASSDLRFKDYLWGGLLLGIADLCRSTLSFFPFFYVPVLLLLKRSGKELAYFLVSAAISFLVILPWTVRNYKQFGGFLLVNNSGAQLFWLGTLTDTGGRYLLWNDPNYRQFEGITNPIQSEKAFFQAGVKNIRGNPLGYVKLTVIKFFRLWFEPIGYTLISQRSRTLAGLLLAVHFGLIFAACAGIWKSISSVQAVFPLYCLLFYFTIMHNIVAPMPRFRLPVEPYLLLFSTLGVLSRFKGVLARNFQLGNGIRRKIFRFFLPKKFAHTLLKYA